jgi:hypothetical protein
MRKGITRKLAACAVPTLVTCPSRLEASMWLPRPLYHQRADGRDATSNWAQPFLEPRPTQSSSPAQWRGIALENYTVPAVFQRY